jgi:hypothetical protein
MSSLLTVNLLCSYCEIGNFLTHGAFSTTWSGCQFYVRDSKDRLLEGDFLLAQFLIKGTKEQDL